MRARAHPSEVVLVQVLDQLGAFFGGFSEDLTCLVLRKECQRDFQHFKQRKGKCCPSRSSLFSYRSWLLRRPFPLPVSTSGLKSSTHPIQKHVGHVPRVFAPSPTVGGSRGPVRGNRHCLRHRAGGGSVTIIRVREAPVQGGLAPSLSRTFQVVRGGGVTTCLRVIHSRTVIVRGADARLMEC